MNKIALILLLASLIAALKAHALTCAIATGYAPYQFVKDGTPAGIDAQIVGLYNEVADHKIKLVTMSWDEALAKLYYTNELDCVWGMETDDTRQERFLLSKEIYSRQSTLFLHKSSKFENLKDLQGQTIVGDKNSDLEDEIRMSPLSEKFRIRHSETKKAGMELLKQGKVFGVVMPYRVGKYFESAMGLELKVGLTSKKKTPVGVAVKKGREELLDQIQATLDKIPKKKITKALKEWKSLI